MKTTLSEKRTKVIKQIMEIAEHYKHGNLHGSGAMADFGFALDNYTEFAVNAKLQEAAEKIGNFNNEGFNKLYRSGYNNAIKDSQDLILDLQIKQQ